MTTREQISKKLQEVGAAWYRGNDEKYSDPDDPVEDVAKGRKSYHIYPDANNPILESIVRLDSLEQVSAFLQARSAALAAPSAGERDEIMQKFWQSLK